jgi:uncharacterized protein YndB with AHSA1/START domain
MSIAPIVKTVEVRAAPASAFELFTQRMGDWWPKRKTLGKSPHVAIIAEPQVGGRWFEQDAEGVETLWGRVLAWEPPSRVLLAWQINSQWQYDPTLETEVEITFVPTAAGGTRVTLEHRNLERFGAAAATHADTLRGGWPTLVVEFARFADEHA